RSPTTRPMRQRCSTGPARRWPRSGRWTWTGWATGPDGARDRRAGAARRARGGRGAGAGGVGPAPHLAGQRSEDRSRLVGVAAAPPDRRGAPPVAPRPTDPPVPEGP